VSGRNPLRLVRKSIILKISLIILLIESIFLVIMGVYYYRTFSHEVDARLAEKMSLPATLMSQMALNFESVTDYRSLEEIVDEHVDDAFITREDGTIFYSSIPSRIGTPFSNYLDPRESFLFDRDFEGEQIVRYQSGTGRRYLSILSPLIREGSLLGFLYIRIQADRIEAAKHAIILIFLLGSIVTVALTILVEAFFVHRLFVPRIKKTVAALESVAAGNYSARVLDAGAGDQIGMVAESVNTMIAQIETHMKNLQALTQAGEDIAAARDAGEIYRTVVRAVTGRFPVTAEAVCTLGAEESRERYTCCREFARLDPLKRKIVLNGEILCAPASAGAPTSCREGQPDGREMFIYVPILDHDSVDEVVCMTLEHSGEKFDETNEVFVRTLSRLTATAVRRVEALEEKEEAEQGYRDLFTNAVEGIFRSSIDGRIEEANPSMARMMGYDTPESLMAGITDIGTQGYADVSTRETIISRLREKGRVADVEVQLRRRDGSLFWASITGHGAKGEAGEISSFEGVIIDISERKKREEAERERGRAEAADRAKAELLVLLEKKNSELEETLDKLRQAQRKLLQSEKMAAMGTMAGGVAHDLNNILSGIVSYPDLLLTQLPENSDLRESMKVIRESGLRAAAVVADLLTLSRGAAYNTVIFDLNLLVERSLQSDEISQLKRRHPEVGLDSHLAPDLWHTKCSPGHIEKAILNLASNAFDAVGDGGRVVFSTGNMTVEESGESALSPGKYVFLKVTDTAAAIPAKDLERLFEPFYAKRILGRGGTGLDLAVVWHTAEEHKGTVAAESGDEGTVFSFILPAAAAELSRRKDDRPPAGSEGSGTVLVVDDESQLRTIASRMLTQLGYRVVTASSGEEAVAHIRREEVDLVLLDMVMPSGMGGYETYVAITGIRPRQRVVVCSGYSEHEDLEKMREAGVSLFLGKPYTLDQVGRIVGKALFTSPDETLRA
jgi:PAS domain S-box-containing protein